MEITKKLYVKNRIEWRKWLKENCKTTKEIWLVYYNNNSGKPRIPYNDAVEEALCFGWIDSTIKKIDEESFTQRFTPRNKGSRPSELNKERLRRLIKQKKMTAAGLAAVNQLFDNKSGNDKLKISPDILSALKADKTTWKYFQKFPLSYKRIRIGWIEGARKRPEIFEQRLRYFLKMTAKNKRYGMLQ